MTKVGVIGATGYAGAELVRLLAGHPEVELSLLTSRQYAGSPFSEVYPALSSIVDTVCETLSIETVTDRADILFTALPHKLPMELVPELLEKGTRVVDLSADFRFKDAARYEAFYQPHTAKNLLDETVYGLSEIYRESIRTARLIGNPGCYPTSVLLPLIPLIRRGWIQTETIVADSKSGVSGAGRSPSLATHFCEVNDSFKAYKIGAHRHAPEMEEILSRESGHEVNLTFVPHLVPMTRGMLTTQYMKLTEPIGPEAIRECLSNDYARSPFVRICPESHPPDTRNVRGSNFCDIGFVLEKRTDRLILISAIDNLVKGAAGQAVQNMNIMLGLDERAGLLPVPFPI
jgi:N-acetyl-gamma-glutamyl-phosphate reductase